MKPDAQTKASEVKKERKNKYGRHGWNTSIKIYFLGDAEIMHQAMYIGRYILHINTALFFTVSEYKLHLLTFCSFFAGGRYFRLKSQFYYKDHKVKSSS